MDAFQDGLGNLHEAKSGPMKMELGARELTSDSDWLERRRQDLNLGALARGGFQDRCPTGLGDVGSCGPTARGER